MTKIHVSTESVNTLGKNSLVFITERAYKFSFFNPAEKVEFVTDNLNTLCEI